MRDPMLQHMRAVLTEHLPRGAFLKRDRDAALFITDAPRRGTCPDWASIGFLADVKDGLARLTPDARWLLRLEAESPEPPSLLCAQLQRIDGPVDAEALKLFAQGLKKLDGGPYDPSFDRNLRQLAAVTLRKHEARGGLYACGLIQYRIDRRERHEA